MPDQKPQSLPQYRVRRVFEPPPDVQEARGTAWESVPAVRLVEARTGAEARSSTLFRVCWTEEALHILFECADSELFSRYRVRDEPIYNEEVVELFLAPEEAAPADYLEFEVSPYNVQWDGRIHNPGDGRITGDVQWDAPSFRSYVHVAAHPQLPLPYCSGWTAGFSVAFRDLSADGRPPGIGEVWRANLYRIEHKPEVEHQAWSPTLVTPASFHVPQRFGRFVFAGPAG